MSSQKGDFTCHTPRGNIQYREICSGVINLLDTFTNLPGGEDLTNRSLPSQQDHFNQTELVKVHLV